MCVVDEEVNEATSASKFAEIVGERRRKRDTLRENGIDPYPVGVAVTDTIADVRRRFPDLEAGAETGETVTVAGRVMSRRLLGKISFLVLREDGHDLQLVLLHAALDASSLTVVDLLDAGDWVAATGEVISSKTGELSVRPVNVTILAKGVRPLPDKWHGLNDVEQRFRQRELDLTVNDDARRVFQVRATVLKALRDAFDARGFVEVETPMLHPIPGGATAKPFVTHHNALDMPLYLRIAPELYLKRLIAGGMRRVYEVNRSFRNEGMSPRHNPEFTMLESYAAYDDYHQVMAMTEEVIAEVANAACGTTELEYQGRPVSVAAPFRRVTLLTLVRDAVDDQSLTYDTDIQTWRDVCQAHEVPFDDDFGVGKLALELYEALVEHTLWDPTFVTDYPVEVSPLARTSRDDPHVTERFELIMVGREHANAFSELTDPDDQRQRFEAQMAKRVAGDDEAMQVDESYLRALELGMPPCGGLGIGIDRLVMLLADVTSIREVILFPTLRPEQS